MTDKQIIIDKYPDCEYYNFSLGGICDQTTLSGNGKNCAKCLDINGCFIKELYKQLKRKEQECDKLYIQLKADEEYHKEEENTLRKIIKNKEERNIELYKENNKLKQTLTEIKEIAENAAKYLYATKSDDYADGYRWLGSIILQKISECEAKNE